MIITILALVAINVFLWILNLKESDKSEKNKTLEELNKITETYLQENAVQDIIYENTLEKSPEIQSNSTYKPRFKEPIVVMLRSGNLAILTDYESGQKQPLSGIIGEMNNKDLRWTWKLNGKVNLDGSESYHDIMAIIGELE